MKRTVQLLAVLSATSVACLGRLTPIDEVGDVVRSPPEESLDLSRTDAGDAHSIEMEAEAAVIDHWVAPPKHDADTSVAAPGGGPWQIPTCAEPSGPSHVYTSVSDIESALAGAWFLCSGYLWGPADTAGIEFTPEKAHLLVKSGESLVRGTTWDYERDVLIRDNGGGHFQIELSTGGGMNYYFSRTSEDGRFLELNTMNGPGRFVRTPRPKQ